MANYSVYGRRKLHTAAQRCGLDVGRDQVARLMAALGIAGATRARNRFTTRADPAAVRAPDLVGRHFSAERPDALWVADFTYCSTWSGIVYVAFVVDVFSRRIVGWKAARTMAASLVVDALNMAAWARRGVSLAGLVCHSDAGSQYTSIAYTDRLAEIGAQPSIGTVADSYDNALAESAIGLFKAELHRNPAAIAINGGPWKGLVTLRWRSVAGSAGSTRSVSTASSTIRPRRRSRPPGTAATRARPPPQRGECCMTPSSNDAVTIPCPVRATPFEPIGKRRYCRDACRVAAHRRRHRAPDMPAVLPPLPHRL